MLPGMSNFLITFSLQKKKLESGGMTLYLICNKWEVEVLYLNGQPSIH